MAGQIITRGRNKWLVRIFIGRDPKTRKRKYASKLINGTKKDAQAYLNAKLREQDMGQLIEPTKLTLKGYLDRWLTEAASIKLRERTYREYVALLGRYAQGPIGEMRLGEVTSVVLQSLYADLMKSGGRACRAFASCTSCSLPLSTRPCAGGCCPTTRRPACSFPARRVAHAKTRSG